MVEKNKTVMLPLTVNPGQEFSEIVRHGAERVSKITRLAQAEIDER